MKIVAITYFLATLPILATKIATTRYLVIVSTRAYLRGGSGGSNPPKFSDFFLKSEGKEIKKRKKEMLGRGGYLYIFLGLIFFRVRLRYFQGGLRNFRGVEIFSGGVEKFSGGLRIFQGGLKNFRGGLRNFRGRLRNFLGG